MKPVLIVWLVCVCNFAGAFHPDDSLLRERVLRMQTVAEAWKTTEFNDTIFCTQHCPGFNQRPVYLHYGTFPPGSEFDFVKAKKNDILGPYVNANSVSLYKYIGREPMPDSVRFSQILVAWYGAAGAQPYIRRSKAQAQKRADSLCYELRTGRIYMDEIMIAETDDMMGLIFNRGNYGWMTRNSKYPQTVIDVAFTQQAGSFVIAESDRGYHVLAIEEVSYVWDTYAAWEITWNIDPCYDNDGNPIASEAIYPGGSDAIDHFFNSEKTKYDSLDVAGSFDYPVLVFFDVLEDGSTANVEILYQEWITPGIVRALTRLVRSMPKWKPATTCDGPVSEGQVVVIYL